MSKPTVIIAGNVLWAKKELKELSSIANVVHPDISSRSAFLTQVNKEYPDAFAIYATHGASIGGYDRETIEKLPKSIKFICSNGAGYDAIDVQAATDRGIGVSHTPGAVDEATATTALFLLLSAFRQYSHAEINARANKWLKDFPLAHNPEGKTLGIVGMGGIGSALARRVLPLGMKVQYHNRKEVTPKPDFPVEYVDSLDKLLETSDVISLHLPLNNNTKGFFGEEQFAKMKDGSILVNTARGGVVDQEALIKALDSGKLYSAGLDVFPNEPEIDERLRKNHKIAVLPHVGTHTLESRYEMEMLVLNNIRAVLEGKNLVTQVPEQRKK